MKILPGKKLNSLEKLGECIFIDAILCDGDNAKIAALSKYYPITGLAMVTNVSYLFSGCTGMLGDIHALYVYLSTKPIAVSEFSGCFRGCTQAVGYESIPASWR